MLYYNCSKGENKRASQIEKVIIFSKKFEKTLDNPKEL